MLRRLQRNVVDCGKLRRNIAKETLPKHSAGNSIKEEDDNTKSDVTMSYNDPNITRKAEEKTPSEQSTGNTISEEDDNLKSDITMTYTEHDITRNIKLE